VLVDRNGVVKQKAKGTVAFKVPFRGLIGFRNDVRTETKGTALIHQQSFAYEPHRGAMQGRLNSSIVAQDKGAITAYALEGLQDRGLFFVEVGSEVYSGQVVGSNNRSEDLLVNVVKKKNLTNHRAAQTSDTVKISTPLVFSLEKCLEYIEDDELLEVTPQSLRIRKKYLDHNERKRKSPKQ